MIMTKHPALLFVLLLALVVILAACGSDAAAVDPTVTAVSVAAAATTSTAVPSPATAVPTATLLPPPVLNEMPTSTSTVIPTPTVTPTPVVINSLDEFGDNRNPLTGELVEDPTVLQRRPLIIKISNNPPQYTRPQHGIGQADLVFEHVTETNITRFSALFYGETPPDIGPVRSARLIDLELPAMYDAGLVMSGSHPLVSRALYNSDVGDRILREVHTGFYRTGDTSKPSEHTLHADPVGLWEALDELGSNRPPRFGNSMTFNSVPPNGGDPATHIALDYSTWSHVEWDYDAENGRYWRTVDGETFVDGNNDEQVSVSNVIILYAPHVFDQEICVYPRDDGGCDLFTTEIQIWGEGFAYLMRDGQKYEVTWLRRNRADMFTFVDDESNPVPLQIGKTWFQIVPFYYDDPVIR